MPFEAKLQKRTKSTHMSFNKLPLNLYLNFRYGILKQPLSMTTFSSEVSFFSPYSDVWSACVNLAQDSWDLTKVKTVLKWEH